MFIHIYTYKYIYVCMCVFIYIYIYVCIYMHLVWEVANNFFDTLPLAATIGHRIFCTQGGMMKPAS